MSTEILDPEIVAPAPARQPSRLPALMLAAAVVVAGFGVWFTVETHGLRSADSAANHALVDTSATAEVTSAISLALNRVFSYSFENTDVTEKAASVLLRGKALETYNQLFGQVKQLAPQEKIVLATRVVSSAVQSLDGAHARLLVFMDQSATRAGDTQPSVAAAQLSITAERQNGVWVITDLVPR